MGYIYKITNKIKNENTNEINEMCYIGQTINDLNERFRQHRKKSSNCVYLRNALQHYGKENFKFELVCICFDCDLNRYEEEYIQKYDCIVPNGYNLKSGGNNGGKHSEETKRKISEANKGKISPFKGKLGRKHTEETKKKISENSKEQIPWNKGVPCKEETKKKISNSLIGKRSINVIQYDLNGNFIKKYSGVNEAANELNTYRQNIYKACIGKYKTCKGFIWKYSK